MSHVYEKDMNKINLAKIKENMDTHEKAVNKSSITETGEAVNKDDEDIVLWCMVSRIDIECLINL